MRVLLSEIFPPTHGGSGRWFWEIAKRSDQHKLMVLTNTHEKARDFDDNHNAIITRVNLASQEWGIKSLAGLKYYATSIKALRRIHKDRNLTKILCGRCIPEGFMGYLMHLFYKIPYACFVHGEDIETAKESRELSWIVKQALKSAEILICNSRNSAQILEMQWHINPDKIRVVHPGVDTKAFQPAPYSAEARRTLNWHDRPVLLTVGRLQKRKGHDKVIEALPILLKTHPNLLYCIIGQGEEYERLNLLAKKYHVTHAVQFKSDTNDAELLAAYQQCNAFILANRTVGNDIEGFGMVLAEAQACGKMVIAGDSGGTREAMIPNETGYVIDATKTQNIAEATMTLLASNQHVNPRCRQFVVEKLDWEVHFKKLQDLNIVPR